MEHLYEMSANYRMILDAVKNADGEMTDEQMEALLAGDDDINSKVANTMRMVEDLEASAGICGESAGKLMKKGKTFSNNAQWLRNYVLHELQVCDKTTAGDVTHGATRTPGKLGVDDLADDADVEALPIELLVVKSTVKPDKKAILDAAKDDEDAVVAMKNLASGGTSFLFKGFHIRRGAESLRKK